MPFLFRCAWDERDHLIGVPLPPVTRGGTAMMTVTVGCGLALGVDVRRDLDKPRHPTTTSEALLGA